MIESINLLHLDKIFIFSSSLLKNKGKLINLDIKKLAIFFN